MSNWERKAADTLADAIEKHCKRNPGQTEEVAQLCVIQKAVDGAANTVTTSTSDLERYRSQVCAICRASKLYDCDVPEGWSRNCAFIYENTTAFTPL